MSVLPGEGGEGHGGVRRPGDDVEQDDDERDLRHLPLVLQPMETLHGITSAAVTVNTAVNLPHCPETHTSFSQSLKTGTAERKTSEIQTDWLVVRMARKMKM